MLAPAFFYQSSLYEAIKQVIEKKELYFFFMYPSKFFSLRIDSTEYNAIQYVSKNQKGEVIGFVAAYVDHSNDYIENLDCINFTGKPNVTFTRDILSFFDEIFIKRNFRKISFRALEKNPAVKIYRKLMNRIGGNEVGLFKENKKLTDGKFYDEVYFEIFKDDYIKATEKFCNNI